MPAAGDQAKGATAYVTLEPCGARSSGRKSCAHFLTEAGVARVVIACLDPSPFAAGRGTERLRDVPRHPGLYGFLGYASRGLIWAGLGAELLAAQIEGEPLPLEANLVDALDPARFVLRARRSPRGPRGVASAEL